MKKCIIAILALFYLGTSVGATFHMHYCMGELVDWSLNHQKSVTCNSCGMEKNSEEGKNCCKDEHKRVKLDKHNSTGTSNFLSPKLSPNPIYITNSGLPAVNIFPAIQQIPLSHSPPGGMLIAIFIRNCVFRI